MKKCDTEQSESIILRILENIGARNNVFVIKNRYENT